jgi:hypothetical protein
VTGALLAVMLLTSLRPSDVERAVALARWPTTDAGRERFHGMYVTRFPSSAAPAGPMVESIEVVTEFRRVELITEAHERMRDMFAKGGYQDAMDAVKPWQGQVSIVAHVRFGLVTIGTPDVGVSMTGENAPVPVSTKLTPLYANNAVIGADVEVFFASDAVGQTRRIVAVRSNGVEIARTTVDFGAID